MAGVLIEMIRADWCPMVSYTKNLERIGAVLLNTGDNYTDKLRVGDESPPPLAMTK